MDFSPLVTTNFKSSDGMDLGEKLITKDYLLTVYPQLLSNLVSPSLYVAGYADPIWSNDIQNIINYDNNNWKTISASKFLAYVNHMAAIKYDGSLWTGGYNAYGQLGLGNFNDTSYLQKVTTIRDGTTKTDTGNWKEVYCGATQTLALKNDGSLWACGRNENGQLGLGDTNSYNIFTKVGNLTWKSVCTGLWHSLGITTNGDLYSWGSNANGTLGIDLIDDNKKYYTPIFVGSNYAFIDTSLYYSYAITNTGELRRWGSMYSQAGSGILYKPTQFGYGSNWKKISCGYRHSAAIREDGALFSVGSNLRGGLGTGDTSDSSSFVQVYNKSLWKHVSCGNYFTTAIKLDGSLWAWGNNWNGQLGIGSPNIYNPFPSKILDNNCKKSACFAFGQLALKSFEYI